MNSDIISFIFILKAKRPLDDCAVRRLAAHKQLDAEYAAIAHHADLAGRPIFHDIEQGHDSGGRKIDILHAVAGLVQNLAEFQRDWFRFGGDGHKLRCGQRGQQKFLHRVYSEM